MTLDPDRLSAALSAAAGGVMYGVYHLATLWLSGRPGTWADYRKALVNMLVAVVIGVLLAWFFALIATAAIPWASLRDAHAVGFVMGAFGWELLPVIYEVARKRTSRIGDQG
jgi:hypothetical protein